MRKFPLTLCLCLAATFALARPVAAQDDDPATLRLSVFQCDWDRMEELLEELETMTVPIWNELQDEGMIMSAGTYVHAWADEWNLGLYTVAESIEKVLEFNAEVGRRSEERYPDYESVFGEACPKHKDGFYTLGPSTGDDDDEDDAGGAGASDG